MKLRRGRFDEVIARQLEIFAADEAALLDEADEADAADEYRGAFHVAVARRFRRYASLVADLEP